MAGEDGGELLGFRQHGQCQLRSGQVGRGRRIVLGIRQHIDLCRTTAVVVMVAMVRVVAVVMDVFAGNVPEHPDNVPAPVFVTGVDTESHVRKYIGDGHQQAEELCGCMSHKCKNTDK